MKPVVDILKKLLFMGELGRFRLGSALRVLLVRERKQAVDVKDPIEIKRQRRIILN